MAGSRGALQDFRPPAKLALSALWASLMLCYVYGDYFGLYMPGKVMAMNAGRMGPLGLATDQVLVAVSLMMAIPALMIAGALLIPAAVGRWLNLVLGLAYTAIMAMTMAGGAPPFYLTLGGIEIAITLAIVWRAVFWPRESAGAPGA
ncbi:DUF6326 family protein [Sphingomonas canadensis]|uniref:DUF6326 family protein n=1 Tax=Sphingomonas canadensis TaxID=1219257 RepID=A0ABW3H895_9SPHN|nr:DUF6326 family protein [Sphingomonas canadensis]MCW3837417.1 DUF6326 family protein [Sphingomonas canadensis]